jgi:hypothetical protein
LNFFQNLHRHLHHQCHFRAGSHVFPLNIGVTLAVTLPPVTTMPGVSFSPMLVTPAVDNDI